MTCCSFLALLHILGAQKFLPDNSENSVVLYDWSIADVYLSITIRLSLKRLTNYTPYFKKWANPGLFFIYFWSFQTNIITIFTTNKCEKCPSSIRCWELNHRPSERESLPITTRHGLPPKAFISVTKTAIRYGICAKSVDEPLYRGMQPPPIDSTYDLCVILRHAAVISSYLISKSAKMFTRHVLAHLCTKRLLFRIRRNETVCRQISSSFLKNKWAIPGLFLFISSFQYSRQ